MRQLGGWLGQILAAVADAPLYVGTKTGYLACQGIAKLDELTALDNVAGPPPPALVDSEGRIRINSATSSRQEGTDRCHRISAPVESTCDRSVEIILEGVCTHLPQFEVFVRDAVFLQPDESDNVEFREYRHLLPHEVYDADGGDGGGQDLVRVNLATYEGSLPRFTTAAEDSDDELTSYNRGLTRLELGWDFQWDNVDAGIYDSIDGFVVFLHPDPKSVPFVVPDHGLGFVLPRWLMKNIQDTTPGDESTYRRLERVDGLFIGGLTHYPENEAFLGGSNSNSLSVISHDDPSFYEHFHITYEPVGGHEIKDDFEAFNSYAQFMPVAPGFRHAVQVAPYVGVPGDPAYRMGPVSDKLWLEGNRAACEGVDDPESQEAIRRLYNCKTVPLTSGYDPDDEFRPGLLALTGTDICDDIFSSTPAAFTWDNSIVKQVWALVWIIAGGVFFVLFAVQGLRMTYDIWLNPQPAVGFRELVPRYLLALLLAAGSLLLCRMVLTVASDLTCFVAQFTGMSLWGAVGATFGMMIDAFMAWYEGLDNSVEVPLLKLLSNFLILFAFAVVVVAVLIFILYLFAKVLFSMLIRVALLAVLIALSPLAFAFYASDLTAHWTKKWVSMFLGATFQQVVVLIVIYLGIKMMGDFMTGAASDDLTTLIIGAIIAFMTLSVAASIPGLVNPGGEGHFSAFSSLGSMAMAGGMMAASGGASALLGGAVAGGSALGSAAGALRGRFGGGGGDDDDGSGGGGGGNAGGPTGTGGGSGGATGGQRTQGVPVISSVSRLPVGGHGSGPGAQFSGDPGGQPAGAGGAEAGGRQAGSGQGSGQQQGSPAAGGGQQRGGGGVPVSSTGVVPLPGQAASPGGSESPDSGDAGGAGGGAVASPGAAPSSGGGADSTEGGDSTDGGGSPGGAAPSSGGGGGDSTEGGDSTDGGGSPGGAAPSSGGGGGGSPGAAASSSGGPRCGAAPSSSGGGGGGGGSTDGGDSPDGGESPGGAAAGQGVPVVGGVVVPGSAGAGGVRATGPSAAGSGSEASEEEASSGAADRRGEDSKPEDRSAARRRRRSTGLPRGPLEGWRRGVRFGSRMNVLARDVARGNIFYRNSSSGDDSASRVSGLRQDLKDDRESTKEAYAGLATAINNLNRNLGGEPDGSA